MMPYKPKDDRSHQKGRVQQQKFLPKGVRGTLDLLTSQFYFLASKPTRQCISVTLNLTAYVNWQPWKVNMECLKNLLKYNLQSLHTPVLNK